MGRLIVRPSVQWPTRIHELVENLGVICSGLKRGKLSVIFTICAERLREVFIHYLENVYTECPTRDSRGKTPVCM